jgi:two-component system sensor histidine kinase PilS (NtrC family)
MNDTTASQGTRTAWRALRLFNLYRLVLSGLFSVLVVTGNLPPPLGSYNRRMFALVVIAYLALTVVGQAAVERRFGSLGLQTLAQVLLDIVAITLMMYASGGVTSGLGMLLVVSIAGGSILAPGRNALLFAAVASLAVLGEELYSWLFFYIPAANYTHAGFLGGTYFATALLAFVLGQRLRASEALAAQQALDLESLARLNEHIIQRMQSGIVAVDAQDRVRLINAAAIRLLGTGDAAAGRDLVDLAPALDAQLRQWRVGGLQPEDAIKGGAAGVDVLASFTGLGAQGATILLEDAAAVRQRAQQLKLASLGRLTASIAHEVRNPLGAISHAAQLLDESAQGSEEDRRLVGIIQQHSRRVNTIIDNVMSLSRREPAVPEGFAIKPWLEEFAAELRARFGLDGADVVTHVQPEAIAVCMDPSHLHQVLSNLCENALRYRRGRPLLELRCGIHALTQRPHLDVIDRGPGMPASVQEHVFEPFFTTEADGTGLGLYLAAEMCEANQAALVLKSNSTEGCCFRINFAHPGRRQRPGT